MENKKENIYIIILSWYSMTAGGLLVAIVFNLS